MTTNVGLTLPSADVAYQIGKAKENYEIIIGKQSFKMIYRSILFEKDMPSIIIYMENDKLTIQKGVTLYDDFDRFEEDYNLAIDEFNLEWKNGVNALLK